MAKEQNIITKIFLNDEQAKNKLEELEKKMENLRQKRDKAFNMGKMDSVKDLNKQLQQTQKEMSNIQISGTKINHTLENLSTASIKELRRSITVINNELKSGRVKRGSEDWEYLTGKLKKCREELKKINDESRATNKSLISRATDFLNKNWGAITQYIAGFATLTQMVRGTIKAFADMQQEMQNVRKYTGQTTEQVEHMNEVFKQMDTRTSREELNQLAGSAGRLGITAEKDILEFVDAADKINVALGDDLGKGAVDSIGKLAMAFGEDDRMGLRGAMLATGSAVNELAQNSSTQAGYLVEFAARLAGVGVQAKMSQAQIMGWGSVLDENMQKEEMAATALSQIITTMATDSSKMAKVAGLDVKAFADLIKTDMNAALMQFFEAMNKKGGFTALAPMFADMGLDGARATSVLSVLANKIDDVRKNQELANGAYEKGTSVIEEFNVQNETVQAGLDKAKKKFNDLCVELGERLEPIGKYTISTMSIGIRVLKTLIDFVVDYRATIILVTGTLALFTAAKYADIAASKLMAFWNNVLWAGLKKLYAVVLANPWTAAAAGVALLVGAFIDLTRHAREATLAHSALAKVEAEAAAKAEIEKSKIEELRKKIHDNNRSLKERRGFIEELQKIVPDYVAKISKEGEVYDEATGALDRYIKKIKEKAMVDAAKAKMEELAAERLELEMKRQPLQERLDRMKKFKQDKNIPDYTTEKVMKNGAVYEERTYTEQYQAIRRDENALKPLNEQLAKHIKLQEKLEDVVRKQTGSVINNNAADSGDNQSSGSSGASSSSGYVSEKQLKKQEQERKKREAELKREQAKEKSSYNKEMKEAEKKQQADINKLRAKYAQGDLIYTKFEEQITQATVDGIQQRMDIMQKYGFQNTEEYDKLQAEKLKIAKESNKKLQDIQNRASIRDIEFAQRYAEEKLRVAYNTSGDKMYQNEMALNEALFQNDLAFLRKKQELYSESSEEFYQITEQIDELQKNHQLDLQQLSFDKLLELRKQFNMENIEEMEKAAQAELKVMYESLSKDGKMTEDEYNKMLQYLKDYYAKKKRTQKQEQADKKLNNAIAGTSQSKQSAAADAAFKNAKADAITQLDKENGLSNFFTSDVQLYQNTVERLKEMYKNNEISHAEMCEAMSTAQDELANGMGEKMKMVMDTVGSIMNGMSNYYSAAADYEINVVTKKYDKQIEAAGNNSKKTKKLEEQKEKEIAKIKTKYNKKAMVIQVAQAMASTAQNAISAFGAVLQPEQPWTVPLAYAAAAAATASGMLQIAAIKKQHAAEQAGYYEGGFTGGKSYRREAGVVHEGEFVANHRAVENQNILPFLQFIDQAQRNNTVGSLTQEDVSRQLGGNSAAVVAPVVNVTSDNSELRQALEAQQAATVALLDRLSEPIEAQMVMHDFDRDYKRYQNLLKNK